MRKFKTFLLTTLLLSITTLFIFGCKVQVDIPEQTPEEKPEENISELEITSETGFLLPGDKTILTVKSKDNKSLQTINWTISENPSIEIVTRTKTTIEIKGLKAGVTTITAIEKETGREACYEIEVKDYFINITNKNIAINNFTLDYGVPIVLDYSIISKTSERNKPDVVIHIENQNYIDYLEVVQDKENNTISIKSKGDYIEYPTFVLSLSAQLSDSFTAKSQKIYFSSKPKSKLEIKSDKTFLIPGESVKLTVSSSDNVPVKKISWSVIGDAVEILKNDSTDNIEIKANKIGFSTITATDVLSDRKASYEIEVKKAYIKVIDEVTDLEVNDILNIDYKGTVTLSYSLQRDVSTFKDPEIYLDIPDMEMYSYFDIVQDKANNKITIKSRETKYSNIPEFKLKLIAKLSESFTAESELIRFTSIKPSVPDHGGDSGTDGDRSLIVHLDRNENVKTPFYVGEQLLLNVKFGNHEGLLDNFNVPKITYSSVGDESALSEYLAISLFKVDAFGTAIFVIEPKEKFAFGIKIQFSANKNDGTVGKSEVITLNPGTGPDDIIPPHESDFIVKKVIFNNNNPQLPGEFEIRDVRLSKNNQTNVQVVIERSAAEQNYKFDENSISIPTIPGGKLNYVGRKEVAGQKVLGRPVYNHKGTDWVEKPVLDKTEIVNGKYQDTWTFTVNENKTARDRGLTLKFVDNNDNNIVDRVRITQPRSYNQHETVLWIDGVTPPSEDQYYGSGKGNPNLGIIEVDKLYVAEAGKDNGWFNVNKIDDYGGEQDSKMCWAMAVANGMHWWARQNGEDTIDKLIDIKVHDKENNLDYKNGYYDFFTYHPSTLKNGMTDDEELTQRKNKSSVGRTMRHFFTDEGYFPDKGLDFFFKENNIFGSNLKKELQGGKTGMGLLAGIPGIENDGVAQIPLSFNIEETNNMFNDILINEKAVLVEILHSSNSHEVTIWGIIYDDYGDVIGLYIADNNYPGQPTVDEYSPSYLQKYGIVYREGKMPNGKGDYLRKPYITKLMYEPDNAGYTYSPLLNLTTLESSKKQIAEYVEKNWHPGINGNSQNK